MPLSACTRTTRRTALSLGKLSREEWRCVSKTDLGLSVTIALMSWKQEWSVDSSDSAQVSNNIIKSTSLHGGAINLF